jgi:hypothetical protein
MGRPTKKKAPGQRASGPEVYFNLSRRMTDRGVWYHPVVLGSTKSAGVLKNI